MMKPKNLISFPTLVIQDLGFRKKINWLLVGAIASTFVNGLVISLWIFPALSRPLELQNYGDGWAQVAENIVRGNGFVYSPNATTTSLTGYLKREPAYPLFLAFILLAFGKLEPYIILFQALLNSLTCFVLYFVVAKIFDRRVGLLACFFYAFYPFASWYVPRIAYESLLGLFVTLLLLALVNLFQRLSFRRALMVGLLLGITVLCRGLFFLFPLALLAGLVTRFRARDMRVIGCWMTVVAAMLLVLSPWALRNYSLSREFVPVTSMGGLSYFIGNKVVEYYSVRANTAGTAPDREAEQMYSEIRNNVTSQNPTLSQAQVEAHVDKAFRKMALEHIMAHPLMFIEKILKGAVLVWFQMDTGIKSTGLLLMQAPLLFLALTGIFYALKTKMPVLPLLTVLIYFVLIQTSLSSYGRYSYATIPVLIAFAAYGLDLVLLGTWRHRYTTKRGVENRNLSAGPTVAFRRAIPSSRSLTDCRLLPTFLCRK